MRTLEITRSSLDPKSQRAILDVSVCLMEDGTLSGDYLTKSGPRRLPLHSRINTATAIFELIVKQPIQPNYMRASDYLGEMIVTLRSSDFEVITSLRAPQMAKESGLHETLVELENLIQYLIDRKEYLDLSAEEARQFALNRKHALHFAARDCDITLMADILAKFPEQLEMENNAGLTPLEETVWFGEAAAVHWLIRRGAQVNISDPNGQTPLHVACFRGEMQMVEHLVAAGADLEAITSGKWRPIHFAMLGGYEDLVNYLRSHGARSESDDPMATEAARIAKEMDEA